MKKNILLFLILFEVTGLHSQNLRYDHYVLDFENSTEFVRMSYIPEIDDNIWKIGEPMKGFFFDSKDGENVICTDLSESYRVNDTSSFIIQHIASHGYISHPAQSNVEISGYYKVDCDSLLDGGGVEYSDDGGTTWIDLLKEQSDYVESSNPVFTGKSDWTHFHIRLERIIENVDFQDTVLYKFSFTTDGIFDDRDGLMFDCLMFEDYAEGVDGKLDFVFDSKAFPNPSRDLVQIAYDQRRIENFQLKVFDSYGRLMLEKTETGSKFISIDTRNYQSGIYFYELKGNDNNMMHSGGRFIILRDV